MRADQSVLLRRRECRIVAVLYYSTALQDSVLQRTFAVSRNQFQMDDVFSSSSHKKFTEGNLNLNLI
jgi:hypothetical protein